MSPTPSRLRSIIACVATPALLLIGGCTRANAVSSSSTTSSAAATPASSGASSASAADPTVNQSYAPGHDPQSAGHNPKFPAHELVSFPSGALTLHGFLFHPEGPGPFPAVVFNHGSELLPGPMPGQAQFYVAHGFALFVPHRRGQGRSQDQGRYIDATYDAAARDSSEFIDELVKQSDDVMAAVDYVRTLPYVDRTKVAVAGCSLGGIESLLAAERGEGIVAAVDFAGAAMTWATNTPLQDRLKLAARNARVPVFFLQAENDFDTTPSRVLGAEMTKAGKHPRVHIFPPNGKTAEDGHGFCAGGPNPPWGDEVLAFLADAMKEK